MLVVYKARLGVIRVSVLVWRDVWLWRIWDIEKIPYQRQRGREFRQLSGDRCSAE